MRATTMTKPLMLAAAGGHVSVLRLLIDHGADLEATNRWGQTALMAAVGGKNNPLAVKTLLEGGAQANARDNAGTTALLIAADRGDPNCVQLLLDDGADPRIANDKGVFPLERVLFIENKQNQLYVMALLSKAQGRYKR